LFEFTEGDLLPVYSDPNSRDSSEFQYPNLAVGTFNPHLKSEMSGTGDIFGEHPNGEYREDSVHCLAVTILWQND
jgi:hypothetical protein